MSLSLSHGPQGYTVFIISLRCYLLFSRSSSHRYTDNKKFIYGFRFHTTTNLKKLSLVKFWHGIIAHYPQLFEKAVKILLPCPTTELCGAGFSSYTLTKATYGNTLNVEQV